MKPLRVGEVAQRTGKSVRALHLYEEMGLLRPMHRSKGGFRLYSPAAIGRVEWITKLQDAGFSLHQLKEFMQGVERSGEAPAAMHRVRDVFAEKLRETREQMERLQRLERDLVASLDYLEACKKCESSIQVEECGTCNHQGHQPGAEPLLVAGIHRG